MRRVTVSILVLTSCWFLSNAPSAQQAAQPPSNHRPIIIFIHGRAQAFKVISLLREEWFAAFRDGYAKLARSVFDVERVAWSSDGFPLDDGMIDVSRDLRFVNYEWIYEPYYMARQCPQEFAIRAWPAKTDLRKKAREILHDLVRKDSRTMRWVTKTGINLFLADTETYLSDDVAQCDTNRELRDAIREARTAGRPVVLVAHSMGAMVAYRVMQDHPAGTIVRWVTVGSQLASPAVVQALMRDEKHAISRPAAVTTWLNIFGKYDQLGIDLKDTIADPGVRNVEISTDPDRAHWIGGYLKNPQTTAAIVRGWCDGFPAKEQPASCKKTFDAETLPPPHTRN